MTLVIITPLTLDPPFPAPDGRGGIILAVIHAGECVSGFDAKQKSILAFSKDTKLKLEVLTQPDKEALVCDCRHCCFTDRKGLDDGR